MKDAYYFKHDYNARGDERLTKLRMIMGAEGYGIYWLIVEKLYESAGRLDRDCAALSWALHEDVKKIKKVIDSFDLFYDVDGKIACHRVDRDLENRREISEKGREFAARRWAKEGEPMGSHSEPNARRGEERKGEERIGKEITTAKTPSAVDFSQYRLHIGQYKGVYVVNVPVDECEFLLKTTRMGLKEANALKWRIAVKKDEANGMSKVARL